MILVSHGRLLWTSLWDSPSPPPLILGNPISPAPPPMDFELINSCCAPLGDAAVEDAWRTLALTPWDPDNNKYGSVAALR